MNLDLVSSQCGIPATAQAVIANATVVPTDGLSYLTLWPTNDPQPLVSTLNSSDNSIVSNLAIVPLGNNSLSAFATQSTQLILDVFGYFAP